MSGFWGNKVGQGLTLARSLRTLFAYALETIADHTTAAGSLAARHSRAGNPEELQDTADQDCWATTTLAH